MSITDLFNKFADREIAVTETPSAMKIGRKTYNFTETRFADPRDPLLEEMKKTAAENGLELRIWLPDSAGTDDMRMNRVNVRVDKRPDGKYRVNSHFTVG